MTEKIFFYYTEEGLLRLVTSRLETGLGDPVESILCAALLALDIHFLSLCIKIQH